MNAPGDIGRHSLHAFGSRVVLATTEPDALRAARHVLVGTLRSFDLACSRFRDDSELVALNRAGGRPTRVGPLLWEAVCASLHVARITGGLVDPTVGRALRLAGYDTTFPLIRLREGRLVAPMFEPAGRWRELELDPEAGTITLPLGVELDLGSSAKALAADRAAIAAARAAAGAGVLVSIGGDIACAGPPPPRGWSIRIADDHSAPLEDDGPTISIVGGGVASSGTRVRRWATAEGVLHHILDPRTGRPAHTPWRTVSVAAATCLDANAASTAAVVLGAAAPAWLDSRRLPARLAAEDGSVVCVGGWPAGEAKAA